MAASKLTNEEKLKRLIYINNTSAKYVCGGPDKYVSLSSVIAKRDLLDEFLRNSPKTFFKTILSTSEDKLLPHRATLHYVLASALTSEEATAEIKHEVCETVLKICKSDQDFFDFIKYVSSLKVHKKLPPTVLKAIRKFYKNKSSLDLANSYARSTSYHTWSYKDLIKLGHVRSDTPLKNVVINFILTKKAPDSAGDNEKIQVLNILNKSETLRKTKDHKVAVPIIAELKATINQVQSSLRKSAEVWNAVLPNMTLSQVLQVLPKLYKLGFLKKDTPIQALVNENLTNIEKVKASGIHPVEVFIHMKNFEKGGKPLDPKLLDHLVTEKKLTEEELKRIKAPNEARSPIIINNLQKCMSLSCNNIQSSGKRYMVTIDVTDKMDNRCLHSKNITGLEAATAFTMALLKVEKDVTIAVFKQKEVSIIQLDKKGQFNELVQKLKENKSDYLVPASSIEWAMAQKKHIDIFFNFIHHNEYIASVPKEVREKLTKPPEALQKYKKKFNLQNAKLVTFCMSSPHLNFSDGSPNILDVAGLDFGVPKAVEAFCRGNFS